VAAVMKKLKADLGVLIANRDVFFHTINETLSFERTLKQTHSFQTELEQQEHCISCITVFTQHPAAAQLWLELEHECMWL
jgi:succinate dehydrogenase/fumarate reductase-like Fe-S protein